jgi:hypothetical protein
MLALYNSAALASVMIRGPGILQTAAIIRQNTPIVALAASIGESNRSAILATDDFSPHQWLQE